MLAVMVLSKHRVLSCKTVRPRDAQCMGHVELVCSLFRGAKSRSGKGARPHLCMDKWNCAQAIELDPSGSGQAQPNRPGIGYGYVSQTLF